MTPLALEMLMWLRTRGAISEFPNCERAPQQEIIVRFITGGICTKEATALTPLGDAWLDNILETPVPVIQYVDPRHAHPSPHLSR